MRRDHLFYKFFQQSPNLLFDLINQPPENAAAYRFESVAIKEPKFEIDGVFLPLETAEPGTVYFCEVQFQKDEALYERLISESAFYFYRNRSRFCDWHAVIIYPSRSAEQSDKHPFRAILHCEQVHRIFLDELGDPRSLPLPIAAVVLTIVDPQVAPETARSLLSRVEQEPFTPAARTDIIDLVTSIMMYKFATLSRMEIRTMLGLNLSEEPRAIREAKAEGREEQTIALIARQLSRRFQQELSEEGLRSRLGALSLPVLEDLSEALLEFQSVKDLEHWLAEHC
jgi:predicted transposase/invertase (TIGR01784 family)